MKTFIVSDIHANYQALINLLSILRPTTDDQLLFLGDYLDKNPYVRETLVLLKSLQGKCRCVFLKGNHEFVWVKYLKDKEMARREFIESYGGLETLRQFSVRPELMTAYLKIIDQSEDYKIVSPYFATHAGLLAEQLDDPKPQFTELNYFVRPRQMNLEKKYLGQYRIVAGHTCLGTEPTFETGYINIDLGAGYPGGFIGALDVSRNEIIRSDGRKFTVR